MRFQRFSLRGSPASHVSSQVAELWQPTGLWMGATLEQLWGHAADQEQLLKGSSENQGQGQNERTQDVNVGDPSYLDCLKLIFQPYQDQYDLSHWKLDGFD